jgi:hypothetical protein
MRIWKRGEETVRCLTGRCVVGGTKNGWMVYDKTDGWILEVNNMNDQLIATITTLLIFESAQNVSGNLFPIFRSVRPWLQQCRVLS